MVTNKQCLMSLRMLRVEILRSRRLSLRRATIVHNSCRLPNLIDISVFDFLDAPSSIQLLAYCFVGLDELVYLSGKLVILSGYNVDMIVHWVYFVLHGWVVLMECLIRISSPLQLLPQIHHLVFLLPNPNLKFPNTTLQIHICHSFSVNSLL